MNMRKKVSLSIVTLAAIATLGACGTTKEKVDNVYGDSSSQKINKEKDGVVETVTNEKLKYDGYFKDIVTHDIDPRVETKLSYDTDYDNADWDNITFKVDHAKFVTVDHYEDTDGTPYKTLASLHYKLENEDSSDKHITPDTAELVMKDGEHVKAEIFMNVWDDEVLTSHKHKDGYMHFKVADEKKLEEIKAIDITFKAKDSEGNEVTHTYTVNMPIDAEK